MMEEPELFKDYEIKGLEPNARLLKIVGVAALFHVVGFVVIAQLNLLQAKACDSPYIGKICQVLDVAYVGSIVLGTDHDFVDKAYEKSEIDDSDVTLIDVTEPFKYPEGYFAASNPPAENTNAVNGITQIPGSSDASPNLFGAPQVVPTPNKNAVVGAIPDSPFSVGGNSTVGRMKPPKYARTPKNGKPTLANISPDKLPDVDDKTVANANTANVPVVKIDTNSANTSPNSNLPNANTIAVNGSNKPKVTEDGIPDYEINKRPLKDYGLEVKQKVDAKEVDLGQPFSVSIKGVLKKDGKLDTTPGRTGYTSKPIGDEKLVNLVKSGIEAVNASGYLQYLEELSGKDLKFEIIQDDKGIVAVIQSEMESDTRASSISSALNFVMTLAKNKKQNSTEQDDKDDLALLQSAKVAAKGKTFELRFELPREIVQDLINRKLASVKDEAPEKKNKSGTAANVIEKKVVGGAL